MRIEEKMNHSRKRTSVSIEDNYQSREQRYNSENEDEYDKNFI